METSVSSPTIDPKRDHWIPNSRILPAPSKDGGVRGGAVDASTTRTSPLSAGSTESWDMVGSVEDGKRVFYLVGEDRRFKHNARGELKIYRARDPISAARKAFYAYYRSPEGKADVKRVAIKGGDAAENLKELEASVHASLARRLGHSKAMETLVNRFVRKCAQEDTSALGFQKEICVLESERKAVRTYLVGYKRNRLPNRHQAEKLITKDVVAQYIPVKKRRM